MMAAVHFARVRIAQPLAHQRRQQRVLLEPDLVREGVRLVRRHRAAVLERARHLRRDVLDQRAAAGDVQHLDAAADREDRQICAARASAISADLELVAAGLDVVTDRGMRAPRSAPAPRLRRRSAAARRCRPAPPSTRHRRIEDRGPRRRREGSPAGSLRSSEHGLSIANDAAIMLHPAAGTSMPIRSSARGQLRPEIRDTPAARQRFRSARSSFRIGY